MALTQVQWESGNIISLTKMLNMVGNTTETWDETDKVTICNYPAKDYGTVVIGVGQSESPSGFYNLQFAVSVASGSSTMAPTSATYSQPWTPGNQTTGSSVGYHYSRNLDISSLPEGVAFIRLEDGGSTNYRYVRFYKTEDMDYLSWWVYLGSESVEWLNEGVPTNKTVYFRSDLTLIGHRTTL